MKEETEITRWIVRVDKSKKVERAVLVGLDKDGSEYTFQYFDSFNNVFKKQDIICTDFPGLSEAQDTIKDKLTNHD